jgi:hypothetical protein
MAEETETELVIGRGRLFFERFEEGQTKPRGVERFFGNAPDLTTTQAVTKLDHYASTSGMKTKDKSAVISNDKTGTFSTDDISAENVATWFLGDGDEVISAAAVGVVSAYTAVPRGVWLQLGANDASPGGARKVLNVVVKSGVAPGVVVVGANYDLDLELGRIYVHEDAPAFAAPLDLTVTFDTTAGVENMVIPQGKQVFGALRFIADNAVGENKDHYWSYVELTPNGDYALIGDDWQKMSFNFEVLRPNGASGHVITIRA